MPVSYTHLDVYKRQPLACRLTAPQLIKSPPPKKGIKIKNKCHCNKCFITNKLKLKIVEFANKFSF